MLNWINLFLLGLLLAAENAFCGPVPESSAVEDKKLEDIKSKLANLQTLLQQLNRDKKSDVTTPLPLATVPPTESQSQEGETEKSEDDEVYSFLNKLTSEEVALLQDVKEKLQTARQLIITKAITGHNTKDREGEILHDDSTKPEKDSHGSIKTDPNIPQVPANPTETKDKGHFLDKVWSESELGKVETPGKPSGEVQISEGRFGAFKHDLIEDVESRLLSDVKYAKAHGINLKDIAKDFENRAKVAKLSPKPRSTASDEREDKDLASLHKRPLPPSNM